ncbi:hypothetical protein RRG08_055034 [Elysia crispata]|uniref:Uncharacterized protein n=1 Tax=Elysia crispata TaxID=231223 RepID=A0AAE0XRY8_9GAST|nr:hypothetical protein RRG08_055034 [Elysia crispata]
MSCTVYLPIWAPVIHELHGLSPHLGTSDTKLGTRNTYWHGTSDHDRVRYDLLFGSGDHLATYRSYTA